ncbi:hypothetical protein GQ43DRAFT_436768 [Delitschia confertaspora ATCC 74209]|uniref:Mitochondrial intermembrane space import and assembly protein 40 n=1 Tax=Delitschia confertaspora ATCC 74209 TaxID=1513339 RepID=A0A9P4JV63_9PLEO|nr:hypothetical protein GQ43DRAFT_436768 [Delitschia confertaspora ATCC 74209]
MFRQASRLTVRSTTARAIPRAAAPSTRRFLSTAPPAQKSRSWKSSAVRWGLAGGLIYYYQTHDLFADEPSYTQQQIPETDEELEQLPTIDALVQERLLRKAALAEQELKKEPVPEPQALVVPQGTESEQGSQQPSSVEELEEEAGQQGAFNPETGEINWDCPCLGGMADGPCGEEFKAAFSCFVFSTEEPKGMDCIEKFKGMQNCFREYPEIYGAELQDDEEPAVDQDGQPIPAEAEVASAGSSPAPISQAEKVVDRQPTPEHVEQEKKERAQAATTRVARDHEPVSESSEVLPKEWHDTTSANQEVKK